MQFEQFSMGCAIYHLSHGKVCDGCPIDGDCEAQKKLYAEPTAKPSNEPPPETVRAEATRLGISISEVRRRRNAARVSQ